MKITNAQYQTVFGTDINCSVTATIDGKIWSIPLKEDNSFYNEIMRQVDAGELTIEPSDE